FLLLLPLYSHLRLLFYLLHRPPTSTLFPYTTLFRSADGSRPRLVHGAPSDSRAHRHDHRRVRAHGGRRAEHSRVAHDRAARGLGDRKSTRLNSSHGSISYAVFCLKKTRIEATVERYV